MIKGYIQCRDGVYWDEKKRKLAAIPLSTTIYNRMKQKLFDARLIHCDGIPFNVIRGSRPAGTDSYMWVYHTYERYGVPTIYIYEYNPTRNSDAPRRFLKDFQGVLVTDGY